MISPKAIMFLKYSVLWMKKKDRLLAAEWKNTVEEVFFLIMM